MKALAPMLRRYAARRELLLLVVPTLAFFLIFSYVPMVGLIVALFRSGLPPEQVEGKGWVSYAFKPLNVWADQMTEPLVIAGLAALMVWG